MEFTTDDNDLSDEQRALLLTVVTHYRATYPGTSQAELMQEAVKAKKAYDAKAKSTGQKRPELSAEDATRDFRNFVQKLAPQGVGLIFDYFRHLAKETAFYRAAPLHIRRAIQTLYGRPDGLSVSASVSKTLRAIQDPDPRYRESISRTYHGVWDVFRFAGHGSKPVLMWAAMQISPADLGDPSSLPGFVIHYRPHGEPRGSYRTADGFIVSLVGGLHMWFVGRDHADSYPLDILAEQRHWDGLAEKVRSFTGLVKRRHERESIMTSRLVFLRKEGVTLLSERHEFIDAYEFDGERLKAAFEREHSEMSLETLGETARNRIKHDGKFVLFLK